MVPEVGGAAAVDGDGPVDRQIPAVSPPVFNRHQENFHIPVFGDEGGNRRGQIERPGGPLQGVAHKARCYLAVVLGRGEFDQLLLRRHSGDRPDPGAVHLAPDISGGPAGVQILYAHRLQEEGLLVQLGVAAQIGRKGAFESRLAGQREIEAAHILGSAQSKGPVFV